MDAPSRPNDDVSLLTSILTLATAAKAKLPSGSPAAADLNCAIAIATELIERVTSRGTPLSRSSPGAPPLAASAHGGSETILVVEDNETILTLITTALARMGYRVLSAHDGMTALERYGSSPDDIKLLVTDVLMPRMSGRELAQQLTALRPSMRVLYASGYTQDVTSRHGVFEPDVNFIQKPYTPLGLAARIRQILDTPSR